MAGTTTAPKRLPEPPASTPEPDISFVTERSAAESIRQPESNEAMAARLDQADEDNAYTAALAARDAAAAAEAGVDPDLFATFSIEQKQQALGRSLARKTGQTATTFTAKDFSKGGLSTEMSEAQFASLSRSLVDLSDEKSHVVMCDPPIDVWIDGELKTIHPGVSRIGINARDRARKKGFTLYPRYPFMPEPTISCKIAALSGEIHRVCDYKGHTDRAVEDHMEDVHRTEYARLKQRDAASREELSLKLLQRQVELAERQAAAVAS